MRYLILSAVLLAFGCTVTPKEEKTEEGLDVKDVRVVDPASPVSGCYTAIQDRDTANFVVQKMADEKSVFADLEFRNFEKDASRGSFNGEMQDDLLIGYYKFASEGVNSVSQTVFKVQGDTLYQAYGDMEQVGDTAKFKNLSNLQFLTEKPFVKRDCE